MSMNIAIVGAGISGMSTAYSLLAAGHRITIYSKAFSPNITSDRAAAFWFPYHIRNDKRGIAWCQTSYACYQAFSKQPDTGITMHRLIKVLRHGVAEAEPLWMEFMPEGSYRTLNPAEQPGYLKIYEVNVPLIETQIFLPWLYSQLKQKGVVFIEKEIYDLEELMIEYEFVVNCSALGARKLCGDEGLIPVRGQVALLAPMEGLPIYLDNENLLYVVPRKDAIIIGGTYEPGVEMETTESAIIDTLLKNAYEVFPVLRQQKVIGSWAGLRPYRTAVRVEREAGKNIIHNYGHGGSGFTLAFGCANAVVDMI